MKESISRAIKYHANLSAFLYSDSRALLSGADPIDGEYHRLIATTLRRFFASSPDGPGPDLTPELIAHAIDHFRAQWLEFCAVNNAKVAAAPKLRTGPSSGHSVISHRWADPGKVDQAAIDIGMATRPISDPETAGE